MTEETDVIDQADALMRRHRSFVARVTDQPGDTNTAAVATGEGHDADIPLLTEMVESGVPGASSVDGVASKPIDTTKLLDGLRADIEQELSVWLVEELPAAVANASQSILTELDAKARHTLLPRLLEMIEDRRAAAPQTPANPSV